MKRSILLFSISLTFLTTLGQENTWAPIGAKWYYSYNHFAATGFYSVESTKDTLITVGENTQLCSVLEITQTYMILPYTAVYEIKQENQYMYADADKVYIYKMGKFYTLYDFSAKVGDSWEIPYGHEFILEMTSCEEVPITTGKTEVSYAGDTLINGLTLRYFKLKQEDDGHNPCETNYCWALPNDTPIIEKIGPVGYYMLPNPTCVVDVFAGGPLRCYSEDGFVFETDISPACDYIVGVNENNENHLIRIIPNPATDAIRINCNDNMSYRFSIVNVLGQVFMQKEHVQNGQKIAIHTLPEGMYVVTLTDGQNNSTSKKLQIIKQ